MWFTDGQAEHSSRARRQGETSSGSQEGVSDKDSQKKSISEASAAKHSNNLGAREREDIFRRAVEQESHARVQSGKTELHFFDLLTAIALNTPDVTNLHPVKKGTHIVFFDAGKLKVGQVVTIHRKYSHKYSIETEDGERVMNCYLKLSATGWCGRGAYGKDWAILETDASASDSAEERQDVRMVETNKGEQQQSRQVQGRNKPMSKASRLKSLQEQHKKLLLTLSQAPNQQRGAVQETLYQAKSTETRPGYVGGGVWGWDGSDRSLKLGVNDRPKILGEEHILGIDADRLAYMADAVAFMKHLVANGVATFQTATKFPRMRNLGSEFVVHDILSVFPYVLSVDLEQAGVTVQQFVAELTSHRLCQQRDLTPWASIQGERDLVFKGHSKQVSTRALLDTFIKLGIKVIYIYGYDQKAVIDEEEMASRHEFSFLETDATNIHGAGYSTMLMDMALTFDAHELWKGDKRVTEPGFTLWSSDDSMTAIKVHGILQADTDASMPFGGLKIETLLDGLEGSDFFPEGSSFMLLPEGLHKFPVQSISVYTATLKHEVQDRFCGLLDLWKLTRTNARYATILKKLRNMSCVNKDTIKAMQNPDIDKRLGISRIEATFLGLARPGAVLEAKRALIQFFKSGFMENLGRCFVPKSKFIANLKAADILLQYLIHKQVNHELSVEKAVGSMCLVAKMLGICLPKIDAHAKRLQEKGTTFDKLVLEAFQHQAILEMRAKTLEERIMECAAHILVKVPNRSKKLQR